MQNLTNISNYLGKYNGGVGYKKFDFVFNEVDGLYYYAKNDIPWQGNLETVSENNRFTLDPSGPIYGGKKTFYLFDSKNDPPSFMQEGALITIDGSEKDNNGSYKIIRTPEKSYNSNHAVPGDYVLSELLDAVEEGQKDWFVSDWFLLGENNFYWPGRDFESYVNQNEDVLTSYLGSLTNLTKEEFGRQHYEEYGEAENRALPINADGGWFYHPILQWVYVPVNNQLADPLDKSFWFYVAEKQNESSLFWFWAKKSLVGENNDAYIGYEEEDGIPQLDYEVEDENKTFNDTEIKELDSSIDGNTLLVRTDTGIKRYENESGTWNQKASLSFNGTFRYLACDGNCDTIAVFGYENRYHKLEEEPTQTNSGPSGYDFSGSGIPWETISHSGSINQVYKDAWTGSAHYYIAGDVYIYRYNATSQSFELEHTIQKIIGVEMTADFDLSGNTLCIFEPMGLVGYSYLESRIEGTIVFNGQNTKTITSNYGTGFQNSRQIKNYSFNGSSWTRSLTCVFAQPHRMGINIPDDKSSSNELYNIIQEKDEESIADFIKQGYTGDLEAKHGQVLAFSEDTNSLFNIHSTMWYYSYFHDVQHGESSRTTDLNPFSNEGKSVALSGDGKRIFWISTSYEGQGKELRGSIRVGLMMNSADVRYIEFDSQWGSSVNSIALPRLGIGATRGISGTVYLSENPERTMLKKVFSIKTNYHGNAIACYGRYESGNDQQIYDAASESYSSISNIIEDTMIEVNGEWQYKELIIEGPKYDYRYQLTNLVMSKNPEGRTRVAGIIGQKQISDGSLYTNSIVHPKKNYDLEYAGDPGYSRDFSFREQNFKNSVIVVLELGDENEWRKCNQFSYNSIDIAIDGNMDAVFNLEYDESSSYKNKLKRFNVETGFEYTFGRKSGALYIQKHDPDSSIIPGGLFDVYDYNHHKRWFVFKEGEFIPDKETRSAPTLYSVNENDIEPRQQAQNLSSRIWLQGVSENDSIDNFEVRGENQLTISSPENAPINLSVNDWVSDEFFFDADYGSSVTFTCENKKYEYSDGYYIYQPESINSLGIEITLLFKNRSNRETNAILHFIESHLGQYDKDRPSPNLKYNLGIDGFRWGGESTFHPYDSTNMQSKTFYCLKYDHSLNFEDSNDVTVRLSNFNTSLLNKSEELFVKRADDYSSIRQYKQNDVVFSGENHQHYYCLEDSIGTPPVSEKKYNWSREGGYYDEINKDFWSRDFFWRPSLGLKISSAPRLKKLKLKGVYTQIHRDGANEKLLNIDLEFNNRSDQETYAILHFLEHHYGCIPFVFNVPSPYEQERNFVCQKWTHTYNFKNNHSIKASFEEYPFKLSSQKYDALITQSMLKGSELSIPSLVVMNDPNDPIDTLSKNNLFRKRVFFKNIGDEALIITSMETNSSDLSIVGQDEGSFEPIMLVEKDKRIDYVVTLPEDSSLPFNLGGQTISVDRSYYVSGVYKGASAGVTFSIVEQVNGSYEKVLIDGSDNKFFQNNVGKIVNSNTGETSNTYKKFIDDLVFKNNTDTLYVSGVTALNHIISLDPGSTGYFDLYYNGSLSEDDFIEEITTGAFLGIGFLTKTTSEKKQFNRELGITVFHSNRPAESLTLNIQMTISND